MGFAGRWEMEDRNCAEYLRFYEVLVDLYAERSS